ncbi:MAG TPA: sigma-70 family RNA polymerase sigma factor [Candidatus Acidoferrales bacterium]|nr:sigma-70 family RNA polymerase sigma factor [Candidatus Acidoferrales bacterium]
MPILSAETSQARTDHAPLSDAVLVKECLAGSDRAWVALIDKYKNLIFSIPIKCGFPREEADDIFQTVCLELLSELSNLRNPEALPKWIMQVTSHKCFHRRREQRWMVFDSESERAEPVAPACSERILSEAEEEQKLRQAVLELPPRDQQLIHMLFFEEPLHPYLEVAAALGIATGSIGMIRQRCLERLRKRLLELGLS